MGGSKQKLPLKTKMMKTFLIFTLAALSSALPMDENRQCEGTLCHAGCCPMQGWYCCEDNMNCATTNIGQCLMPHARDRSGTRRTTWAQATAHPTRASPAVDMATVWETLSATAAENYLSENSLSQNSLSQNSPSFQINSLFPYFR